MRGNLPQGKVFVYGSPMKVGTVYQICLWYNIYTDRRGRRSLRVCDVWHNMRGQFVNRPYGACHFDFCKPH